MTRASAGLRLAATMLAALAASPLAAQVTVGVQAGGRYSSALVRDSIVTAFNVRPALAPVVAGSHLSIEARYDLHPFVTPALRAEGFDASRLVHRVALTVRTDWGATR